MTRHGFPVAARKVGAVTAGVAIGLGSALWGAGAASAGPVTKTLSYTCEFPLVGPGPVRVDIGLTLPDQAVVGQPATATDLTAAVSVPEETVNGFDLLGATTVEGSASVTSTVTDSAGTAQDIVIGDMPVPQTPIPESGDLVVTATGEVPPVTVGVAGDATVAVSDSFTSKLTPRKADGSETELGTFDLVCTVDPGQDPVLGVIPVQPAATVPERR